MQVRQALSKAARKAGIVNHEECLYVPFIDFRSGLVEGAWLLHGLAVSMKASVCVEIGSANGLSACYVGLALKQMGQGRLYAIDPHTTTDWNDSGAMDSLRVMRENMRRFKVEDYVEIIRDYSNNAAKNWTQPIDLLFIDGDHSYEGVKSDWEAFAPHVNPFGVVVFHDTTWDLERGPEQYGNRLDILGVPRFLEELRTEGYPVITINQYCGISMVQATKGGRSLAKKHLRPFQEKFSSVEQGKK